MKENNNIIKTVFDEKINRDKIYNNIIKSEKAKYMNIFKISLAPICIVVACVILSASILGNHNNKEANKLSNNISEIKQNDINESKTEEEKNNFLDYLGTCEDMKFKELVKEEERLGKIKFPDDVREHRCIKCYELADTTSSVVIYKEAHKLRGKFAGYSLMFGNEEKNIEIFVSKTLEYRIGDCLIDMSYFEEFDILGIKLKMEKHIIEQDKECYRILFKFDDLYWDIDTYNFTQQELTDLICSIII